MAALANSAGNHLVLSPSEALVAGGPAEAFEQQVQSLFCDGHRHLVTDLRYIPRIDSAGIRTIVRGYTTSQRLGGTFKLAGVDVRTRTMLQLAHLDSVFEIYESPDEARVKRVSWPSIGLAAGIGAFAVAGLGTLFLCVLLAVLDRFGSERPRAMMVEMEAEGREFPTAHVQTVFARNHIVFEPREVSQGKATVVRYHTTLDPNATLEDLSEQLLAHGTSGISSVAWSAPKKSE
jgi:anti-anti-sigma factor